MITSLIAACCLTPSFAQGEKNWISLFNGKDLSGWTPKFKGHPLGENYKNTFRVGKDGTLQVSYEGYTEFGDKFGHLFYKTPYSDYILRLEYRFLGEQVKGGPGWGWRNSGIMIHGQPAESMGLNQAFPVSAEVQFLGAAEFGDRHTGNLCTPGTHVVMGGKLVTQHVIDSNSPTFRGDGWVQIEVEAHGHGMIIHRVNGQEVLRYEQVQFDPNDADAKPLIKNVDLKISGGTLSLQAESHPIEFRNIKIRSLERG
jgi:hypothetical protein